MARRPRSKAEKFYELHFTVEGSGDFPTDMLRYDQCFPKDSPDARAILDSESDGRRSVHLIGRNSTDYYPTVDRWRSFGWTVTETDGRTW